MKRSHATEAEILEGYDSLMRHVAQSHAPEFLGLDLTMSQAKALYLVSMHPDISMSGLAGDLGIGLSSVSGLVDRLVALAYLERHADPVDRRQQLVAITPSGAVALDRMRELNAEAMRRLLAGLDATERDALLTSLAALDREVQRLDESSPSFDAHPERTSS